MTSLSINQSIQRYIPIVGDINTKNPLAYQTTRRFIEVANVVQMAFAESYINGLELPDVVLQSFFDTCMPVIFQHFPAFLTPYDWVSQETDHLAVGAQELMKKQYDLPQGMLNKMIGEGKLIYPKYSMGLWEKGVTSLEQAQIQMLDDVIEKLGIQDGDNILDFGCGWGSVPNYILSKFPNVTFTGLNLSHEQCEYIRQKMQDPDSYLSSGRFTLREADLNEVKFATQFDKILSIGVFEHVGNLTNAFKKLATFLKPNGKCFIHIITVRLPNNISSAFTHKYIFPHGRYWKYDAVPNCNQDLKTVQSWYLNGMNYAKTLAVWLERFDSSYAEVKDLEYGMDFAKFRRMWRFYLIWFIANFSSCNGEINGNGQFLMIHANA
jgi:cyclopropane-fatty-acyl-phospholipid synthase